LEKLKFKNNDEMPMLGLGTWKSAIGEVYKAVREAINIGYRHFDCAWIYENESEIGEAISDAIKNGDVKREDLWITSKLWNNRHGKENVRVGIEDSLNSLKLDYLDLYLIHWSVALKPDVTFPQKPNDFYSLKERPLTETWSGMEKCVDDGLSKHIGVSNFSISNLKELIENSSKKPEMNQVELHPLLQQHDLLDFCKSENIHMTAYSPLGSMDRNPSFKAEDEPNLFENSVIKTIAEKNNCTSAQVLIKWAIQRGTAVIPKSTNPERLKQNYDAQNIVLSADDMNELSSLDKEYRFINGGFWAMEGSPYSLKDIWG
jgi:alcohol dehydrogenase (NADP+)